MKHMMILTLAILAAPAAAQPFAETNVMVEAAILNAYHHGLLVLDPTSPSRARCPSGFIIIPFRDKDNVTSEAGMLAYSVAARAKIEGRPLDAVGYSYRADGICTATRIEP